MNENEKSRSGLQTAVDFAHAARAAKRIMQAAAASGVHGAAAATAREAFPLLLKVLIAVLVVFIAVPMVIFTALPNIFFGYNSSGTDTVIQMTQQAMTLGGVYMTLGNFEGAQIDSVVTGIAAEYEKNGTTIDHIVVSSAMTDDDLLWVIAINSAAHQQDLNTMSADLIRDFCKSSLSYTPSLSFMDSGDDGVVTTLRIEVKHLDPEKLMDELGFDSEARQWAGALYETLEESDAINKYKSYYEAYQPGYGGDGSYSGDVEYGSGYDNEIDISGFVDPSTKNNLDLAAYAIQAWANNWGYVWGTYGNVLTPALFEYKKQQYPDGVGNYADFIKEHWLGRRTADCIGLIKGYGWLDTKSMTIRYATNGMPDYGADQMYQACKNAGTLNKDYALDNNMVGTHTITRASQYLDGYSVGIEARGNGKIAVAMTVDGTGIMEKIGVAEVEIEYKTNGVWRYYDSLFAAEHPEFYEYNSRDFVGTTYFQGTPGVSYRVTLTVYARNSKGSDTGYITSYTIVCK